MRSAKDVLALERREAAVHIPCEAGYESLFRGARNAAVGAKSFSARTAHRAITTSVGKAGLGMDCYPEMRRPLSRLLRRGRCQFTSRLIQVIEAKADVWPLHAEAIPHPKMP